MFQSQQMIIRDEGLPLMRTSMLRELLDHKTRQELADEAPYKHFFVAGYSYRPGDVSKKRARISFCNAPCLHVKRAALDVLFGNHGQSTSTPTPTDASDKKARIGYLWKDLFSHPSQWWDKRSSKKSSHRSCPDFQHKVTFEALWIDSWLTPLWVKEKLATFVFDPIQSSGRRVASSFGSYDKVQKLTCKGRLKEALHLLELMTDQTFEAPRDAFVWLLRACTRRKSLAEGKQVHSLIVKTKHDTNMYLLNLLIEMYSACGSVAEALTVFTAMSQRNVFTWTIIISACAKGRKYKEAVTLVQKMHQEGIELDEVACTVALNSCANIAALEQGQYLHLLILKKGWDSDPVIQTSLVNMYLKCGCLQDARKVFDHMTVRNLFTWTAIIGGYAHEGLGKEALDLYEQMKNEGMEPDNFILHLLLKACASISALQQGKQLHVLLLQKGLESEPIIQTTLVNMYSKCGSLKDARAVFDHMTVRDVVTWNVMIAGYAREGLRKEVLDLYEQMTDEGIEPDNFTFVILLKACARISALHQGKQLHSLILQKGLESEPVIQTTLVDMYSKCGCLKEAREVFDHMTIRDVISWTAMIAGYAQGGLGKEALDLYEQMKDEGMEPDILTFDLLLQACATISAPQQGKQLHSIILQKGLESESIIQTTLVHMYSKCGCLKDAREVFDRMTVRDVVSWTAMIAGYAREGFGKEALDLYEQMINGGLQANDITYICVLSACSHSGLVDEGCHIFESMSKSHGVTPSLKHYACMVDLLGRAGRLSDAEELILKMPILPSKVVWMSLLGAARKYANVEIGKRAFLQCVRLEPESAAPYLLLIDIYLAAGRLYELAQLRKEISDRFEKSVGMQLD